MPTPASFGKIEMRVVFGVLSLLIALAVVGLLAKKQMSSLSVAPTRAQAPATADPVASVPAPLPAATPQAQSQQIQQQVRQTVEGTLQQARPMPDDN